MIEKGDILLVKGNRFPTSNLVRWATKSPYTHVAMAMADTQDWACMPVYEIDVQKPLKIYPLEYERYDVYRLRGGMTGVEKKTLVEEAGKEMQGHEGYDWKRIIAFFFERLTRRKFVWNHRKKDICSEVIDRLYQRIGHDVCPDIEKGRMLSKDFAHSSMMEKIEEASTSSADQEAS